MDEGGEYQYVVLPGTQLKLQQATSSSHNKHGIKEDLRSDVTGCGEPNRVSPGRQRGVTVEARRLPHSRMRWEGHH